MTIKLLARYMDTSGEEVVGYEVSGRPGQGGVLTGGRSDAEVVKDIEEFEALVARANKGKNRGKEAPFNSLAWRMDSEAGAASRNRPRPHGPRAPRTGASFREGGPGAKFREDDPGDSLLHDLLTAPDPTAKAFEIRDQMNAYLAAQPPDPALKTTPLYRRLCLNVAEQSDAVRRYLPGHIVSEVTLTTTCSSPKILKFADRNALFIMYTHSGRDISGISASEIKHYPMEKEVLIPGGASFKVIKVLQDMGDDYPYLTICLKEVEDDD